MKIKALILSVVTVMFAVTVGLASRATTPATTITVNPNVTYQTITGGWEATAQAGQVDAPGFPNYKNTLFDQAVNDLGITRLRVEIRSSGTSFIYPATDGLIDDILLPMRQRGPIQLNVCYVGFGGTASAFINNPSAYGSQVLAAYQHFQSKYGFIPDFWEVELEPDKSDTAWYDGTKLGAAIKSAGDALAGAGFPARFIAPSATNARNLFDTAGSDYIHKIANVPGAMQYVVEFSYHRYTSPTSSEDGTIASLAQQYGKTTSMLEWIGADYQTLHKDLKVERNSAWQQYALAYPNPSGDEGSQYYFVSGNAISMGSRTKFLRQYFKFIRPGAVRLDATSSNSSLDPLVFRNSNGGYVVVVKATVGASFDVGVPQATYGIKYTTASAYDVNLPDQTGTTVNTSIPGAGVITIYTKSGGSQTPTPTPTPIPSPTPSPLPTQSPCTCPSPTPTPTPTVTPTPTPTPTPGTVPTVSSVSTKSGAGQSFVWTHNSTSSTLVVAVNMSGNAGRQVSSVTAGGASLTQKVSVLHVNGARAEIWGTQVAPTGSVTVTVITTGPPASFVGAAISVANMTSFGLTASATGQSTAPNLTTPSASNELVLDSLCHEDLTTDTVGSGQAELWNLASATDLGGAGSSEPGAASTTMSWSLGASKSWAITAIRLKGN